MINSQNYTKLLREIFKVPNAENRKEVAGRQPLSC